MYRLAFVLMLVPMACGDVVSDDDEDQFSEDGSDAWDHVRPEDAAASDSGAEESDGPTYEDVIVPDDSEQLEDDGGSVDDDDDGDADADDGTVQEDESGHDDGPADASDPNCWTDPQSSLTWQVVPSRAMAWYDAVDYCASRSTCGRYWRLPTIDDLRSLIRGCPETEAGGTCPAVDGFQDCGAGGCEGCPFDAGGGPDGSYMPDGLDVSCPTVWSSSECDIRTAWSVSARSAAVLPLDRTWDAGSVCVRCVSE